MTMAGVGAVRLVQVDFVLDLAAHADGDLLSNPVEIAGIWGPSEHSGIVQSLHILDDVAQGFAMDILFLQAGTSLGTLNAAYAASDALNGTVIGVVHIATTDWIALGSGASYAIPQFNPFVVSTIHSDKSVRSLYLAAIARGAFDAAAADDLHVRLGLLL